MNSPHDEFSLPLERAGASDDSADDRRSSREAPTPSLSRWYRASVRSPSDRARHLAHISASLASAHARDASPDALSRAQPDGRAAQPPFSHGSPFLDFARRTMRSPWVRAAALVAFAAGGISLLAIGDGQRVAPPTAASTRDVAFTLRLPDAGVRHVSLAGDFNAWDASTLPMVRDPDDGTWRVRVPLAPGRHTYSFVVDGTRWVIDPLAPRTVEGALGPANVIAVTGDT